MFVGFSCQFNVIDTSHAKFWVYSNSQWLVCILVRSKQRLYAAIKVCTYCTITHCFNTCTYSTRGVIKESDSESIKFRVMVQCLFMYQRVILRLSASTLVIRHQCPVTLVLYKSAMQSVHARMISWILISKLSFHLWKPPFHITIYAPGFGMVINTLGCSKVNS